jgi:hypothetical protein
MSAPSTEHGPAITATASPPNTATEAPVRVADADGGAVGAELARRELVRLEHRRHRFDAGQRLERHLGQQALVADAADDGAPLAAREVDLEAGTLDALADVVELGVRDVGAGDDDHRGSRERGWGAVDRTAPAV